MSSCSWCPCIHWGSLYRVSSNSRQQPRLPADFCGQACHHSDSSTYLVTRGGGNNSATTTPITNIQTRLLLSSNFSTARLCNGGNNSVPKIKVQQTVPGPTSKSSEPHRHSDDYHQKIRMAVWALGNYAGKKR
jgi:hypothetical protein